MVDESPYETEISRSRLYLFIALLLFVMTVLGILDLVQDGPDSWTRPHAFIEVLFILFSLSSSAFLWKGWWSANFSLARTRDSLNLHKAERDAWAKSFPGNWRHGGCPPPKAKPPCFS